MEKRYYRIVADKDVTDMKHLNRLYSEHHVSEGMYTCLYIMCLSNEDLTALAITFNGLEISEVTSPIVVEYLQSLYYEIL